MSDEFGHPLDHEELADDGRGGLTTLLLCACGHRRESPKELTR